MICSECQGRGYMIGETPEGWTDTAECADWTPECEAASAMLDRLETEGEVHSNAVGVQRSWTETLEQARAARDNAVPGETRRTLKGGIYL